MAVWHPAPYAMTKRGNTGKAAPEKGVPIGGECTKIETDIRTPTAKCPRVLCLPDHSFYPDAGSLQNRARKATGPVPGALIEEPRVQTPT